MSQILDTMAYILFSVYVTFTSNRCMLELKFAHLTAKSLIYSYRETRELKHPREEVGPTHLTYPG